MARHLILTCVLAVMTAGGCTRPVNRVVRHFDFARFAAADQIQVVGLGGVTVGTVSDHDRIQAAARYLAGKQDGWSEAWGDGPTAGLVEMRFFNGLTYVDEVQLGADYLVYGSYHLRVPVSEIDAMVRTLGVDVWHLPSAAAAVPQAHGDAGGSLCVLPHVERARANTQSPEVPPAAEHYSLRLDGGAWVPLSAQTAVLLVDIPLTGAHKIAIRGDGRPFSAFSFSFSDRHDLCLSQSGLYLTWRFHPVPRYTGCRCTGITPSKWTKPGGNPS